MAKRGSSGLSLVVGVNKPAGMTSHDVVNRVRRVFGERRCGHMGTLDPQATGALAVGVGPATRLDPFMTAHDKIYEFTVVFGIATETDDADGDVTCVMPVPPQLADSAFAREQVSSLVGEHKQVPPVYSAIKVDGKRAYAEARRGRIIDLAPRDIVVYDARLHGIEDADGALAWRVLVSVSAGTYVRAIARDLGRELGTCAHVGELHRVGAGRLRVQDCVSLEELEADPFGAMLDPVRLLGLRFAFLDERARKLVGCGNQLSLEGLNLFRYHAGSLQGRELDACTSGVCEAPEPLAAGELVSMVSGNELLAIYEYDADRGVLKSRCGFAVGIKRGRSV